MTKEPLSIDEILWQLIVKISSQPRGKTIAPHYGNEAKAQLKQLEVAQA